MPAYHSRGPRIDCQKCGKLFVTPHTFYFIIENGIFTEAGRQGRQEGSPAEHAGQGGDNDCILTISNL